MAIPDDPTPADPARMHTFRNDDEVLAQSIMGYALERIRHLPSLDGPQTSEELHRAAGICITPDGLGGSEALRRWAEALAPACISQDHPRALSFVPSAPTRAAILFDLVVGASSIYAGSWLEGAGAIHAENEALRWLSGLAGFAEGAGGVFVSGGSAGNLSALVAARHAATVRRGGERPARWALVASREAHSSIAATARVMDVDVVDADVDERGRLTGEAVAAAIAAHGQDNLFAVVATSGTTNAGMVDDLAGAGAVARANDLWFHVDGAYGGAGLAAPSVRAHYDGIEHADSLVVDPHKWLFAPFDCAALIYRDPQEARRAHTQHAEYLDVLNDDAAYNEWNSSDYAYHLSRRARGLPFWFSLSTYGTDAYTAAVEETLRVTRAIAEVIRDADHVELVMDPMLSVTMFQRTGWDTDDYRRWSDARLAEQKSLTVPSSWRGEPVMRFCVVNPRTTLDDLTMLVETMR